MAEAFSPTGYWAEFVGVGEALPVARFTDGGTAMVCNRAGELVTVMAYARAVGAIRFYVHALGE